jgi:histidine triad (HIT) family protein
MLDENCLFCKIISEEIPAQKVFENEHILAFADINPCAEHHYLIIPKFHIKNLNEMQDNHKNIFGEILLSASHLASKLDFAEKGYRIVANTNEDGGQTVNHFHLHLIAGRKLTWPPG